MIFSHLSETELRRLGFRPWNLGNPKLMLIPQDRYQQIPNGTKLASILGDTKVKGSDVIDLDEKNGLLAVGIFAEGK